MTKPYKKRARLRAKQTKHGQLPRHRYRTWEKVGRVSVIRAPNGRFVTWHRVRYGRPRKAAAPSGREPSRQPSRMPAREYGRKPRREKAPTGKQVDAYGTFEGRKRRWKIVGQGKHISDAIRRVTWRHPPKPEYNFKRINAEDISENMAEEEDWDFNPEIEAQY